MNLDDNQTTGVNILLITSTLFYSFLANWITNLDIILSLITKIIPIMTFMIYLIINHERIINSWIKFKNRFKIKKDESNN